MDQGEFAQKLRVNLREYSAKPVPTVTPVLLGIDVLNP